MPIPEISKLNWSDKMPTLDQVKGKVVMVVWDREGDNVDYKSRLVETISDLIELFDGDELIQYAVIDTTEPDPEPLPLWGVKPELKQSNLIRYGEWYAIHEQTKEEDNTNAIVTFSYLTRAEAIEAWNKVAEKLNEISL